MCLHGRHRLRGRIAGRVPQQMFALGACPVLLLRPQSVPPTGCAFGRILVPLDGKAEHMDGVRWAGDLARATDSAVLLLGVAWNRRALKGPEAARTRFAPSASRLLDAITTEELAACLRRVTVTLEAAGVCVEAELQRGHPADVIAQTADRTDAGLIVMGTHGKAGAPAYWAESVAARVLARTSHPVLLVPATGLSAAAPESPVTTPLAG